MSELKPCPFCGGEAELHQTYHLGSAKASAWFVWCGSDECPVKPMTNDYETCVEAIAVWNHRTERTCRLEDLGWINENGAPLLVCDACDSFVPYLDEKVPNYCPFCGEKVVE